MGGGSLTISDSAFENAPEKNSLTSALNLATKIDVFSMGALYDYTKITGTTVDNLRQTQEVFVLHVHSFSAGLDCGGFSYGASVGQKT